MSDYLEAKDTTMKDSLARRTRRAVCVTAWFLVASLLFRVEPVPGAEEPTPSLTDKLQFDKTISRDVLERYLSRAITMEGLLNGRGDLDDNIRMLQSTGAKLVGRALCLWGGEANLLSNLERARQQIPKVHAADPEMILQACIFEIVTTQVDEVPVPEWAFSAFGLPSETRNFRYADMLYPSGQFRDHWRRGQSVPDVSRPETKLWFYFLGASFVDIGCEAIHLGQTELMNRNDRALDHYSDVLALIRSYAAKHARRHMVILDSHVPSGGLVRDGVLLMDFHSFPLRIKEVPEKPQEAILEVGFSDGIYGRSKGGKTFSGWSCEHLPYLVEIDNWGVSRQPGEARAGGIWIWGYDEITWFAHQSQEYRAQWLRYAWDWVRKTDPNGFLQMPGSRTLRSPRDGMRWYYANRPGPAVPEGFGDEDAIRAIWAATTVKIDPAPPGEELSKAFAVRVEGKECPVYVAKVAPRDPEQRWRAMDDKKNSAEFFETASFATFDLDGPARVTVTCPEAVRSVKVLPTSFGIVPTVEGKTISLPIPGPRHVTLEVNDDWVGSLHLFANPLETDVPEPDDPNVIYFGPGIHEVTRIVVGDGKTVYVAGGAIVRCGVGPDEEYSISSYSGLRNYAPAFELRGENISFRGRGIIDGSGCPTHARHLLYVRGKSISIEGVILRDSSTWTIPIRRSDGVTVRNAKLLGYRANSDGIDICNSRDVTVEDCFIRTLDDLIVVKSDRGAGPVERIAARRCVLWNEVAHALSVGAELREDVDDVLFEDCDVIRDKGREWTLRVYHSDAATVSNVRFQNIRIEETRKLISLWIGKAVWSRDAERGHIRGVTFRDIAAQGENPRIELTGFDEAHAVEDVTFQDVTISGKPLTESDIQSNEFVRNVTVKP